MKKFLLGFLVIICIIVLIPYFYLNTMIKHVVETKGSQVTGTKVTLSSSSVSLFSGHGTLNGLKVGNPNGYSSEYAFYLKKLDVDIDLHSLMTDLVVIKNITVDSPEVVYEISPAGNNIYALFEKVRSGGGGDSGNSGNGGTKKVEIRDLAIINGKVQMAASIAGYKNSAALPLPDIHQKNIGGANGGVTARELGIILLNAVNRDLATMSGLPFKGQIENIKGAIQGMFGK